ncbi:MAG: hypothetical protein AAFX93_08365 [Verrucomicrobiota bacterium]
MELNFKLHWFRFKRPITIECSDGSNYTCKFQYTPHKAFWIFRGEEEIVSGISQYSDVWQVRDSKEDKILFVTSNDWGKFSIKIGDKQIPEKEFHQEFGWESYSRTGLASWGLSFPAKEKYLEELAYGYLKVYWRSD